MTSLPAVRKDLLCHQFDDQAVVYDPRADKVHLLDSTTARVMELLKEDGRTIKEVTTELASETDSVAGAALFELAVAELGKAELLEEDIKRPVADVSRRELLRKFVLAGAAAALAPAIVTLSPSRAYAQGSCFARGDACTVDAQCCSNRCEPGGGNTFRCN